MNVDKCNIASFTVICDKNDLYDEVSNPDFNKTINEKLQKLANEFYRNNYDCATSLAHSDIERLVANGILKAKNEYVELKLVIVVQCESQDVVEEMRENGSRIHNYCDIYKDDNDTADALPSNEITPEEHLIDSLKTVVIEVSDVEKVKRDNIEYSLKIVNS